jgi:hypothetical protein
MTESPPWVDVETGSLIFPAGHAVEAQRIDRLPALGAPEAADKVPAVRNGSAGTISWQAMRNANVVAAADFASAQLAADAAGGKVLLTAAAPAITVAVPAQYASVQAALDAMAGWELPSYSTVKIEVTGHLSVAAPAIVRSAQANMSQITLRGAREGLVRTLAASGHSVSGGAGAWAVTLALTDIADVAVGDVVMVNLPKNADNNFSWAYDGNAGTICGRLTTTGTAMTLTNQTHNILQVGDFVIALDQMVQIASKQSATALTLDAALAVDVNAIVYWYFLRPAAGTCATSGQSTTLTLSDIETAAKCTVGDILFARVDDTPIARRIAAISGAQLTLDLAADIPAGTVFGLHRHAEAHCGAFEITSINVGNKTIGYINKLNARIALGGAQITGGTVTILRDVIKNTAAGGNGLIGEGGAFFALVDRLGLIGDGSIVSSALSASQGDRLGGGAVTLGSQVGVVAFGTAIEASFGSVFANYLCAGNITGVYAVYVYQSAVYMRHARVQALGAYGAFCGPGAALYDSNTIYIGSTSAACYMTAGAARYADGAKSLGALSNGWVGLSGGGGHLVESWLLCPGGAGISLSSGASFRIAGARALCAGAGSDAPSSGNGFALTQSSGEGSYGLAFGCTGRGYLMTGAAVEITYAVAVGNGDDGFLASNAAVDLRFCRAALNGGSGFMAVAGARLNAGSSRSRGHVEDYAAASVGTILDVDSYGDAGSVFDFPRNTTRMGAAIVDGNAGAFLSVTANTLSLTHDFESIPANSVASTTAALSGAESRDAVLVGVPNSAATNGKVLFSAIVLSAGQIQLFANNITAAPIDPGILTFKLSAIRYG